MQLKRILRVTTSKSTHQFKVTDLRQDLTINNNVPVLSNFFTSFTTQIRHIIQKMHIIFSFVLSECYNRLLWTQHTPSFLGYVGLWPHTFSSLARFTLHPHKIYVTDGSSRSTSKATKRIVLISLICI